MLDDADLDEVVQSAAGLCWHAGLLPLHWSTVHSLPSLLHAAPEGRF